jgi:hypothetical protein
MLEMKQDALDRTLENSLLKRLWTCCKTDYGMYKWMDGLMDGWMDGLRRVSVTNFRGCNALSLFLNLTG